jgi:hypothetical protein
MSMAQTIVPEMSTKDLPRSSWTGQGCLTDDANSTTCGSLLSRPRRRCHKW